MAPSEYWTGCHRLAPMVSSMQPLSALQQLRPSFHTLRLRHSSRAASPGNCSTHAPGGAACIRLHISQCCRCLLWYGDSIQSTHGGQQPPRWCLVRFMRASVNHCMCMLQGCSTCPACSRWNYWTYHATIRTPSLAWQLPRLPNLDLRCSSAAQTNTGPVIQLSNAAAKALTHLRLHVSLA